MPTFNKNNKDVGRFMIKRRRVKVIGLIVLLAILVISNNLFAFEKYKKYVRSESRDYFIELSLSEKKVIMTVFGDDSSRTFVFNDNDVHRESDKVEIKETMILNKHGFVLGENILHWYRFTDGNIISSTCLNPNPPLLQA